MQNHSNRPRLSTLALVGALLMPVMLSAGGVVPDWDSVLAGPSSALVEAENKFGYGSKEYWRLVAVDRQSRRDEGLALWTKSPSDPRRYKWLLQTVLNPPFYWVDVEQGAAVQASKRPELAHCDQAAVAKWNASYLALRSEFLAAPDLVQGWPNESVTRDGVRGALRAAEWTGFIFNELLLAARRGDQRDWSAIGVALLDFLEDPSIGEDTAVEAARNFLRTTDRQPSVEAQFAAALKFSSKDALVALASGYENRARLREHPLALHLPTIGGGEVDLAQLRGKVVLVDFWSNGCSACIEEMPNIKAIYTRYRHLGFEVVGVWAKWEAPAGAGEQVRAYASKELPTALRHLEKQGVTWPNAVLEGTAGKEILNNYAIRGFPTTWLLGRDGRLIATDLFGPRLEIAVREQLGLDKDSSAAAMP